MKSSALVVLLCIPLVGCAQEWKPENEIPWERAVDLLENCQVASAWQTHDLWIGLTLKDGTELTAREPQIDDIFHVRHDCGVIPIATE